MKKNNLLIKKIIFAFSLLFCISLGAFVFALGENNSNENTNTSSSIQKLEDEKESLRQSIQSTKEQYEEQVQLYSKQEQELVAIQNEISYQVDAIEETNKQIKEKQIEVDAKKSEVNKAQSDINDHVQALRKRLRAMYKFGEIGYLQILIKADSLSDALTRVDMVRFLANYDKKMLEDLQLLKDILYAKQKALEEEKLALENLKEEEVLQKEDLDRAYQRELLKKQSIFMNMEILERQKQQLESESAKIEETLKQMVIKRDYVGGAMAWPLDYNNNIITSYFGPRAEVVAGSGNYHGALDIAAPMGSNIYAALSGEVIVSSRAYGYGEVVMVDHGGGIVTLYAHSSLRLVEIGQYVNKGDLIAKVGSTGMSTGPHLHFEVRVNGTRVDPLQYVVAP